MEFTLSDQGILFKDSFTIYCITINQGQLLASCDAAGAGVTDAANIPALASAPPHNVPVASAVAVDSAVANAIAAVGVP